MAKINAGNVYKLAGFTVIGSAVLGGTVNGLLRGAGYDADVWATIGLTEVIIHAPVLLAAADSLRYELGQRRPPRVDVSNRAFSGRKIPLTANGSTRHIFAHSVSFGASGVKNIETDEPELFRVAQGDNVHTVLLPEIEDFYRAAWGRQRSGQPPLSRTYFTSQRRPRIHRTRYDAMIVLLDGPGLILDRGERRSGRLWLPPLAAMDTIARAW